MVVITRWSYKRGGRKAGFHCNALYIEVLFTVNLITDNFVCRDSVTGQLNRGWLFNT